MRAPPPPSEDTALRRWMIKNKVSGYQMAKLLGISYRMVGFYMMGRHLPNVVRCFKIEQVTRGEVPVASWLATELGRKEWTHMTVFKKPRAGNHWRKKRRERERARS